MYPPVRRDITVTTGAGLKVADIITHVQGLRFALLEEVALVDCFEPKVEQGEEPVRNLTFRLTFRHAERTLKDTEVDKEREKVAQSLGERSGRKDLTQCAQARFFGPAHFHHMVRVSRG